MSKIFGAEVAVAFVGAVALLRLHKKRTEFASAAEEYKRNGFVVVRQLLSASDLAQLQQELLEYIEQVVPSKDPKDVFYDAKGKAESLKFIGNLTETPFFRGLVRHPRWHALAEALIGERALPKSESAEFFNKSAVHSKPTPPHQDNFYFALEPANVCTIWMALDYVDRENGALSYIPGSHREGIRPHTASHILGFSQAISDFSDADEARLQLVEGLHPGDVIAHHGLTIHKAGRNLTGDADAGAARSSSSGNNSAGSSGGGARHRTRRAVGMVYQGMSARVNSKLQAAYETSLADQLQKAGQVK